MMKKVTVTLVGIMLMLTILVTSSVSVIAESGKTWYVPDNFSTIQAAIDSDNVKSGDTIYVKNGTYKEDIKIYKSLTIIGENKENTIIDLSSDNSNNAIEIYADNVTLKDFSIMYGGKWEYQILIEKVIGTIITGNKIIGNKGHTGVDLYNCPSGNNFITDNYIFGCQDGIDITGSNVTFIERNTIEASVHGIGLYFSNNNLVKDNKINGSYSSIDIWHSNNNVLQGNTIVGMKNSPGGKDYLHDVGITLHDSKYNVIGGKEKSLKNAISYEHSGITYDDFSNSRSRFEIRRNNILRNNDVDIAGPIFLKFYNILLSILDPTYEPTK